MSITYFPELLYFPEFLMRDRMLSWELGARAISGGKTMSGAAPVARVDGGGLWVATLTDVAVSSVDHVRTWRALAAILDGGATPVVLSVRDTRFSPWPTINSTIVTAQLETTNSDDSTCSDGAPYVQDVIGVTVVDAADLRATTLVLNIAVGAALRGGECFSIEHDTFSHRLYRVGAVTIDSDGHSVVSIRPPLREAVIAGTRVTFDYPRCVMIPASPDAMNLPMERRFHGKASARFIESLPPWQ